MALYLRSAADNSQQIPLPLLTDAAATKIEQLVPISYFREFDVCPWRNWLDWLPVPYGLPMPPPVRIGTLVWPTGAMRFATYHTVISGNLLDSLYPWAWGATGPQPVDLLMGKLSTADHIIAQDMYCLPPKPLFNKGSGNAMYLLTLVDQRYFWWFKLSTITDGDGYSSWTDLYSDIATDLGISIAVDNLAAAYNAITPNDFFNCAGQPVPVLLDAVAFQLGQRIVVGLDGLVTAQNTVGAAIAQANNVQSAITTVQNVAGQTEYLARQIAGGITPAKYLVRNVPTSVKVQFPQGCNLGYTPESIEVTLASLGITDYAAITGFSGSRVVFLLQPFTENRRTVLTAYANAWANDYYHWCLGGCDGVYSQIQNLAPTGYDDSVEWTLRKHNEFNPGPGMVATRVIREPWNELAWGDTPPFPLGESGVGFGSGSGGCCRDTMEGRPISEIPGFVSGVRQLLGHDANDCLVWYSTATCPSGSGSGSGG